MSKKEKGEGYGYKNKNKRTSRSPLAARAGRTQERAERGGIAQHVRTTRTSLLYHKDGIEAAPAVARAPVSTARLSSPGPRSSTSRPSTRIIPHATATAPLPLWPPQSTSNSCSPSKGCSCPDPPASLMLSCCTAADGGSGTGKAGLANLAFCLFLAFPSKYLRMS